MQKRKRRLPRIALAALAMGALLWLAARSLPALASGAHGLVQAVLLLAVIAAGMAIYGLFLRLFGVTGWREAVNADQANRSASGLRRIAPAWQTTARNRHRNWS